MNRVLVSCLVCLVLWCRSVVFATDTNLMPWLVISSNRLATVQQDFYALPRPVIVGWQTVTQRGPVLFFGYSANMTASKLVLSTNALSFVTNSIAQGADRFDGRVETAAAVWPVLLDTNYSGDATAILIGLEDSAFTMAGPKFQATGYVSCTNRGSWDIDGAEVRKWLRWELCREWWLDNHGVPVSVSGGRLPPGSQRGCVLSNCTDEAASQ